MNAPADSPSESPSESATEAQLADQRARIDAIDAEILALMNRRLDAAQRIGALKAAHAAPAFYRPEREARVLRRLRELNAGPLDDAALEALFREIMSISRGSEAGLSVAVLGPLGTYSEAAARQHFGTSETVKILPFSTIDEIFRAAETGQADFAVAPVENSTEGGVSATLNRLVTTSLLICGEINLRIHHNLLAVGGELNAVERVIAHAQSLAQCRRWLQRNLPGVPQTPVASNAEAAIQAQADASAAAIAGDSAAERYGLKRLAANIEDEPGNATRFLLFSNRPTPPSGDDKTSLLLSCRNRPGALFHLLKPLMENDVDMTRIESRPSRTGLWEYVFFVDIIGHLADPVIAPTLKALRAEAGLYKNLGSYPASS